MMILRVLALALLMLAAPTPAVAQAPACPGFFPGGQPPALLNPRLAQRSTLLCNRAYAVLASGVTRGPLWSAERLTVASLAAARDTPRQGEFHPEARLPRADQAQLDDYRRSGYDRGHMAPAGDMPDEQAQQQSFSLANVVPQAGALNRGPWAGIEDAVRDLAVRQGELYVVTGPAFEGQALASIGRNGVLVPSSTWKAVHDPRAGGTGAYMCSNTTAPTCDTVSVAQLSRIVGIDPFPSLPARMKETVMPLPPPQGSRYASERRKGQRRDARGVPDQLPGPQERP